MRQAAAARTAPSRNMRSTSGSSTASHDARGVRPGGSQLPAPDVDERVGAAIRSRFEFQAQTQTSHDAKAACGALGRSTSQIERLRHGLTNELYFNPRVLPTSISIPPTVWRGTIAAYGRRQSLRFQRRRRLHPPVFREGPFAGNDVPLVSRWTGNAGCDLVDIWKSNFVVIGGHRYGSGRARMDNDQPNNQPRLHRQCHACDLRLGGDTC